MKDFPEYARHREALQGRADDFLDAFPLPTDTSRNALQDRCLEALLWIL